MAQVEATTERIIAADAETVFDALADYTGTRGKLLPEHFNLHPTSLADDSCMNLRERMEKVERNLLLDCLRKNRGNQSQAARELGLPRRTLLYRMDRLNISPADV